MSHRNHPRSDSGRSERDIRQFQPQGNYQSSERAMDRGRDWDSNQMEPDDDWRGGAGEGRSRGNPGFGNPSFGNPNMGNQGYSSQGFSNQGFGNPNIGNQGYGSQGFSNPNFGSSGYSSQGYSQEQSWPFEPRQQGERGTFAQRSTQGGWQPSYRGGQEFHGQSGYGDWQHAGPHTGKGPKGYQRSDDRIREDVSDQLTLHGEVDASQVEVDVKNGEVTLRGTVDSRQAKRMAEDAADCVTGVRQVNNQLRVTSGQGQGMQGSSQSDGVFRGGSSMDEGSSSKRGKGLEH